MSKMEKPVFFYNNEGEKLTGTLHVPENSSDRGVILGHCFTCSRHTSILRDICKNLAEHGFMALRFDFSGNGQSQGDFFNSSYTKHIGEMKQAAAFISGYGIRKLGLGGHSMGAAIALLTAVDMENTAGVCTLAGRLGRFDPALIFNTAQMDELRQTGRLSFNSRGRNLELPEKFFSDMRRYDIQKTIASFKYPIMIIHGDRDEIIPVENAWEAKKHNPDANVNIIHGADHMFSNPEHRVQISNTVVKWFEGLMTHKEIY